MALGEVQALTGPELAKIGSGVPVVTDGPFPEEKEFVARYRIVDVESPERAIESAAKGSAAWAGGRADQAADRGARRWGPGSEV